MTYDLSRLPADAQLLLHDVLVNQGRRYLVAFHPQCRRAVIRHKNASGTAEWRRRDWRLFNGKAPLIVDVTLDLLDLLRELYAAPRGEVFIGFRPSPVDRPSHTQGSMLMGMVGVLSSGPSSRSRRLVAYTPGTEPEGELAAGQLHDLTASWAGDVVPYPAPVSSERHCVPNGARPLTVQVALRNLPWGLGPPMAVVEVRDGSEIVWDVSMPPAVLSHFAAAVGVAAMEALERLPRAVR